MLMNMKEMLSIAKKHHFAIGAFNTTDIALFRAVVEEAEATSSPAILQYAPGEFQFATSDYFAYVVKRLANSPIPFVLHLDHGLTKADCMRAIQAGFTSVMFDGSQLSFEENKKQTREIVELAHSVHVSVEAELGTIGAMSNSDEGGVENITYTNPLDVKDFVSDTKVDALAIAIGTAHGIYPKGYQPKLQLDILKEINQICEIPLVLHGGSDNPDKEIEEACKIGVQKVNISSDIKQAFFKEVKHILTESDCFLPPKIYGPAILETRKVVHHKMELFHSLGKAKVYQ